MSAARSRLLSASTRVLLAMTLVMVITVGTMVAGAYSITYRTMTVETDRALARELQSFSAAIRSAPEAESLAESTRAYLLRRTASGSGRDPVLLLTLPSGRTISNSTIPLEDVPGNPLRSRVPAEATFSLVTTDGVTYRALTAPVVAADGSRAAFQAALSVADAKATATRLAETLAAGGLVALALGMLLSYWATRTALKPLTKMAADAARVAPEKPGVRIDYEGPRDELAALADTLNEMLDRLESAHDEQRRFIADASHELRTPLAVILGNLELIAEGAEPADADTIEILRDEAMRMSRLLDELLALARFESAARPALQPLEVCTLLDEVAAETRALGAQNVTVTSSGDAWIEAAPDLMRQALLNLTTNALAHAGRASRIALGCSASAGRCRITVEDDGPGLSIEDLEHCFDRFYRSPSARGDMRRSGAGLGLAITKRIVELHGGTIDVGNVEPHGARFTIGLPGVEEPSGTA